ncbi:MAG: DsbE family thiol:disulfide interchange protein [Gammaproteobacteria bacterium]|nr:DsbE family thiol:disulfide interchange protein [Gammaproteobacteria bacterium]NIR97310.1 DsbE family thiol:disulfide interchange protein [Gammaproteobacteria bacterium]NIT63353.1 DsbE family thiol:disulfide interchange protein [Gammaproteobacteria bacterium]NIV20280.1 DsbE family thiol:disulfide interchange protein [Gammaproteobacteria bacterium]NIX10697.1 DsbE family thiol:disulfide interchange protein [Gammaproteobacteria bacterium]
MKAVRYLIPLVLFVALVGLFAVGLQMDPKKVPSPLIGKPAPAFELPRLQDPDARLGTAQLKGKVSLLNVWASWCVACRTEHPFLMELSRRGEVPIYGLNYKDERADGLAWLARFGDPYEASAMDADGRVGMDWGVYGVPETFVLDHQGVIRYKHIGPLEPRAWQEEIAPLLRRLQQQAASG